MFTVLRNDRYRWNSKNNSLRCLELPILVAPHHDQSTKKAASNFSTDQLATRSFGQVFIERASSEELAMQQLLKVPKLHSADERHRVCLVVLLVANAIVAEAPLEVPSKHSTKQLKVLQASRHIFIWERFLSQMTNQRFLKLEKSIRLRTYVHDGDDETADHVVGCFKWLQTVGHMANSCNCCQQLANIW